MASRTDTSKQTAADRLREADRNDDTQPIGGLARTNGHPADVTLAQTLSQLAAAAELQHFATLYGFEVGVIIAIITDCAEALQQLKDRRLVDFQTRRSIASHVDGWEIQASARGSGGS